MELIPTEDDPFDVGVGCCVSRNQIVKPHAPPKPKQSGLKGRLAPAVPSGLVKGSKKFLKAKVANGADKGRVGDRPQSRSPPRSVAHEHFAQPRMVELMDHLPPLDEEDAATCAESSQAPEEEPPASPEEQLALDIGQNAHEYLEECFYTEAGVLSRAKFNAIPQIQLEDFKVMVSRGLMCLFFVHVMCFLFQQLNYYLSHV